MVLDIFYIWLCTRLAKPIHYTNLILTRVFAFKSTRQLSTNEKLDTDINKLRE